MMSFREIYELLLAIDRKSFLSINGVHAPVYDQFMVLATWLGDPGMYPWYMFVALLLVWKCPDRMCLRNVVAYSASFVAVSVILVPALKIFLDFPRPVMVFGEHAIVILSAVRSAAFLSVWSRRLRSDHGHVADARFAACRQGRNAVLRVHGLRFKGFRRRAFPVRRRSWGLHFGAGRVACASIDAALKWVKTADE